MPNSKKLPQLPAATITSDAVDARLEIVAPGTFETQDSEMAEQLGRQYRKAIGGMQEIVIFGAMLMQLEQNLSTRGQVSVGGRGIKGGVSAWLEENEPTIPRSTAYRFWNLAIAAMEDFALPAKVDFAALVTSSRSELPEPLQLKQAELFDFVNGLSQRSLLDRWKPRSAKKNGGGDKAPRDENGKRTFHINTDAEKARLDWEPLILGLERGFADGSWSLLPRSYIVQLKQAVIDLNKAIPTDFTH